MKYLRFLVLFMALPLLGCDDKKAQAPKEFEPLPKQGPVGAPGPGGGKAKQPGEQAPPAQLD